MKTVELGEFAARTVSLNPARFSEECFDLLSIPAYDQGSPEILRGGDIGSSKQVVLPGDVMLSRIVPHIRRVWVVPGSQGRRQIASGEWIVFRGDGFLPRWLRHLLLSERFHRQFMRTVAGVGGSLMRARPAHVSRIRITIPENAEQRRVADTLDQADALRAKRREASAQLDTLSQSIFHEMFGDPGANFMGWEVRELTDCCTQVTDGEHQTPQRQESGFPLLSARNVQWGYIDLEDVDYVGEAEFRRIARRCEPKQGDVLISCSGTIGRVAVVASNIEAVLVRSVALVRPTSEVLNSTYLTAYLQSSYMQARMKASSNVSSQANLFQGPIRRLPVTLPPITLQEKFATRVAAIDRGKATQMAQLTEMEALFASLQDRAFKGQL